ncbi:hypothetical protein EG68_00264 [Paragonimus skrjabini miyazakii]|uniref:Multidrug and toxin extrusion protein n=1 Tax=Paragonimus skrjabini miyazakii TaxID=59628 RepID=A0A8S9ZCH2_9TREM|nr:hypothetical protein EG68_00264 [Paragonimus skrjabini miyazakii]
MKLECSTHICKYARRQANTHHEGKYVTESIPPQSCAVPTVLGRLNAAALLTILQKVKSHNLLLNWSHWTQYLTNISSEYHMQASTTPVSPWTRGGLELVQMLKLALPTMLTQLLRFINPSISIMICGHLSREELDASSLATTLINVFGLCVDTGFSTAFDTLFAQVYGSKRRRMLGIFLQRALCVVVVMYTLLAFLHLNIESILLPLKQDPLISSLTAEYIKCFLPGLACDFFFLTINRFLQAQNIVLPMVYASVLGTVFNVIAQYTIVVRMGMGLRASALCLSGAFAIMLLCEVSYVLISRVYMETWTGFDFHAALTNWGLIFRLGIPGLLMISLEEWCFETMTFIAGTMGEITLGAHAVAFQIQCTIYMIPLGIFTAVNVRVGQKLGAFDPDGARFTYATALKVVPVVALCTGLPIIFLRNKLPYIFTEDIDVCSLASHLLPMLLVCQLCEGFAGVSEAVLLACGRQSLGAIIIFVGYYCIGMPISLLLAYKSDYGILVAYTIVACRTDWVAESKQACRNVSSQQSGVSELLTDDCRRDDGVNPPVEDGLSVVVLSNDDPQCLVTSRPRPGVDKVVEPAPRRCRFESIKRRSKRVPIFVCSVICFWVITAYHSFSKSTPTWYNLCIEASQNGTINQPSYCTRMLREAKFIPVLKESY